MENLQLFFDDLQQRVVQLNAESNNEFHISVVKTSLHEVTLSYEKKIPSVLGKNFSIVIREVVIPHSNQIVGLAIDYFDAKNYAHYFFKEINDSAYVKALKILITLYEEINAGEVGFNYSRFSVAI